MFKPDPNNIVAGALGASYRLGRCPDPHVGSLIEFVKFVHKLIVDILGLRPVAPDADTGIEEWLKHTSYNEVDKERLRSSWLPLDVILDLARRWTGLNKAKKIPHEFVIFVIGLFFKEEFYPEPKFFRGILARDDGFKVFFGPFEHLIADILYKSEYFVKKIPVDLRARYIDELLYRLGNEYVGTDHSSFEAIFTKPIMFATTMQLYQYMLQLLPMGEAVCEILQRVLAGKQFVRSKFFTAVLEAIRCSGEMDTSSANGFSNLCFFLFVMYLINLDEMQDEWLACQRPHKFIAHGVNQQTEVEVVGVEKNAKGVVEGDDGLGTGAGKLPGPPEFARLGCVVKEDRSDDPLSMAFCGIIALRTRNGLVNIRSPYPVLARFPFLPKDWLGAKKHMCMTIYRARAFSLLVECRDNPLTHSFACAVLRITKSCHNRWQKALLAFDRYHREMVTRAVELYGKEVPTPAILPEVRMAFQERFLVECGLQVKIEKHFDAAKNLGDLFSPELRDLFPIEWIQHHDRFVNDSWEQPPAGLQAHKGNIGHLARLSEMFDTGDVTTNYGLFVSFCRYSGIKPLNIVDYRVLLDYELGRIERPVLDHSRFWDFIDANPQFVRRLDR